MIRLCRIRALLSPSVRFRLLSASREEGDKSKSGARGVDLDDVVLDSDGLSHQERIAQSIQKLHKKNPRGDPWDSYQKAMEYRCVMCFERPSASLITVNVLCRRKARAEKGINAEDEDDSDIMAKIIKSMK